MRFKEVLPEKGAGIPHWPAVPRLQGCETGSILPPQVAGPPTRDQLSTRRKLHYSPQQVLPSRHCLVGGIRRQMEWVSFLCPTQELPVSEMASDASGSWGCGAWHADSWFQCAWDHRAASLSIAAKELVPTCALWGRTWHAHRICCLCDNQVVVAALLSRSSRDAGVMHFLKCLTFAEAQIGCHLFGVYINTHSNHLADDLSRNRAFSFLSKVPSACHQPKPVSAHLLDLLLNPQADWVSLEWRQLFSATFRRDWQHPHGGRTKQQ